MSQNLLYNVLVLVGVFAGQWLSPGVTGMLVGVAAGMVAAALLHERFGPARRSTDGFWLRHRGELINALCGLGGAALAMRVLPSWPTWLSAVGGWFGGFQVGEWVGSRLGWSGEGQAAELEARGAYVGVLASAAMVDGPVSATRRATIAAAAKRVMADVGYGEPCDADLTIAHVEANPLTPQDAAAYVSQLAPPLQQALLVDVLAVLYGGCRVNGGLPPEGERWLDTFRRSALVADWSLLGIYDRRYARDGSARGSRAQWLAELGLAEGATDEDIRTAYRRRAAEYHPDRHQGVAPQILSLAEAKLAAVTEAYRQLLERDRAGGGAGGPLFFQDAQSGAAFVAPAGQAITARCWVCGRKNRLPGEAVPASARCGTCYALLAISKPPESAVAAAADAAAGTSG